MHGRCFKLVHNLFIYATNVGQKMSKLIHIQRFRFTQNDMLLFSELKKNRVNISSFVRNAIREKIEKDLPKLIEAENKRKEKIKCPF